MLDSRPREIIGVLPDSFRFLDRKVSLVAPVPPRSQQGVPRAVQLHGIGAAEAGHDDRAGERRRRPHDPDLADAVPAVPRRQRRRCSKRRASRRTSRSLKDDLVGDVREGAVGADGDDRHGAADRLRQRREPAAGAGRVAAAGAGDSRRARRRHRTDRPRAAARERDARPPRRRRRPRPGVRRAAAAGRAGAGQPAAASTTSRIDLPVLLFTLVLSVVAGLLFGAIPVFKYAARAARARRCAAAGERRARAASAIARATCWSWRRSRWRWCCSSAPA